VTRPPNRVGSYHFQQLGGRSQLKRETIPVGAWCREPSLPAGDGEAKSHSAPLQESSLAFAPQFYPTAAPQCPRLPFVRLLTSPGDGEHLSLLEPVGGPHGGPAGPRWVVYHHLRHQGWLFGAVNAVWAVWSRTCSSWTSRRRASSSSAWAWTWACRVTTRLSSPLLLWCPFISWLPLSGNSTCQRNPWAVGSWWAVSVPLPMRRLIVSAETPRRVAASPMDTVSTFFLRLEVGTSIGVCLGDLVGGARAGIGRFAGVGVALW